MTKKKSGGYGRGGARQAESWELPNSPFNPDNIKERGANYQKVARGGHIMSPGMAMVYSPGGEGFAVRIQCGHWAGYGSDQDCRFGCGSE